MHCLNIVWFDVLVSVFAPTYHPGASAVAGTGDSGGRCTCPARPPSSPASGQCRWKQSPTDQPGRRDGNRKKTKRQTGCVLKIWQRREEGKVYGKVKREWYFQRAYMLRTLDGVSQDFNTLKSHFTNMHLQIQRGTAHERHTPRDVLLQEMQVTCQ